MYLLLLYFYVVVQYKFPPFDTFWHCAHRHTLCCLNLAANRSGTSTWAAALLNNFPCLEHTAAAAAAGCSLQLCAFCCMSALLCLPPCIPPRSLALHPVCDPVRTCSPPDTLCNPLKIQVQILRMHLGMSYAFSVHISSSFTTFIAMFLTTFRNTMLIFGDESEKTGCWKVLCMKYREHIII